jgi:hypothetical protein
MKTLLRSIIVAALGSTPLAAFAQNLSSQIGTVNRNVERYTLLPGPYLLSPARNMPTMMPTVRLSDSLKFDFVAGQVRSVTSPPAAPTYTPLFRGAPTLLSPELLRFESTIKLPSLAPQWHFRAAPKPQ